jgi:hypothetical protein
VLSVGNDGDWRAKLNKSQPMTPTMRTDQTSIETTFAFGWLRHFRIRGTVAIAHVRVPCR